MSRRSRLVPDGAGAATELRVDQHRSAPAFLRIDPERALIWGKVAHELVP